MLKGSNLLRLADFNQAVVLDAVRRTPGISRAELHRASGLSPQTISNIARRLIDEELVREGEPVGPTRGRPSIPLLVDGRATFAVGVHVDPARLSFVLRDLAGDARARAHVATPPASRPEQVVDLITAQIERLVASAGVDPERVLGIGIAAPGPIDVGAGVVLDPPQLPGWRDVRLRADVHARTGLPVLLDKDVTAAATAELRARPAPAGSFVFLYLGSGVGAGLVIDGHVVRGVSNNIGEVGDMLVDTDAEALDWPGRRGGLAAACVPEALVRQAASAGIVALPDTTDYSATDAACAEICALARRGDQRAVALLARAASRVAVGLGTILNLLDVDEAVLGGPLWPRLAEWFLPGLEQQVSAQLVAADAARIGGSRVGDQIAAEGAAELVLDHFLAPHPAVLLVD